MAKFVEAPFSTAPEQEFSVVTAVQDFGTVDYVILSIVVFAVVPMMVALCRGLFGRARAAKHH